MSSHLAVLITQLAGPALAVAGCKSLTQDIRFVCWKSLLWAQVVLPVPCSQFVMDQNVQKESPMFLVLPEYQRSAREGHINYINYESSFLLKEEGVALCLG